jgi:hypothetical protein
MSVCAIPASTSAWRDRALHRQCGRFARHLRQSDRTQSNVLLRETARLLRSPAAVFQAAGACTTSCIDFQSLHRPDRRSQAGLMQSTPRSPTGPPAHGACNESCPRLYDFAARRRRDSCFNSSKSISPASPLSIPSRHASCSQRSFSISAGSNRSIRRKACCTTSLEEAYRPLATWASMNFASSSVSETLIFMNGLSLGHPSNLGVDNGVPQVICLISWSLLRSSTSAARLRV